jgi:hypothetical protein
MGTPSRSQGASQFSFMVLCCCGQYSRYIYRPGFIISQQCMIIKSGYDVWRVQISYMSVTYKFLGGSDGPGVMHCEICT